MDEWDDFTLETMTAAINSHGFVPGQLGQLGIFNEDGVATTTIKIEEQDGTLSIIEPSPRGGPGSTVDDDERSTIAFEIDHYEINDSVKAEEVQGVRMFGSNDQAETLLNRVDGKTQKHARLFDTTLEHQRIGTIKGVVVSGKGKVLHNLYDRFGIAVPAPIVLGLGAEQANIISTLKSDVVHKVEDELDDFFDHIHAMAGRAFMAQLWDQKAIRETFLADNQGYKLRDGAPDVLTAGGITFERYKTGRKATKANNSAAFIADTEAQVFPVGVPDLFLTRYAPADLEETVNTIGLPRYSRQYKMPNGKGRHLDSQMNAISLCTKPKVLLRLTV